MPFGRSPLPILAAALAAIILASTAEADPVAYWDLADRGPGQMVLNNPHTDDGQNGVPVKAVDLNGDGRDEVIISAFNGDGPQNGPFRDRAGEIHIFFSDGSPFSGAVDLLRPDPRVLEVLGAQPGDYFGCALNHADVDGDGIQDLIVGAFGASDLGRAGAGKVYVLFGDPALKGGATVDLAQPGSFAFTEILGAVADDRLGVWNSGGDVNGDGFTDLVLGADRSDGPGGLRSNGGKIVVLYGPIPRNDQIDLNDDGYQRTLIWGADTEDHFGATVECGDFDGDGYAEVVGAAASHGLSRNTFDDGGSGDGPPGITRVDSGEAWILWGQGTLPAEVDLAALPGGVVTTAIYGRHSFARCGEELDTGDINGDGLPDLLVGSLSTKGPPDDYRKNAGEGYVFYGTAALRGQVIDIALSSYPFLTLYGTDHSIAADSFVSGDINNDGYDDILIGMPHEHGPTYRGAGAIMVVYGDAALPMEIDLADPQVPYTYLEGADRFDDTAYWSASGDVDGDGYDEVIANAMSGASHRNSRPRAGEARIVSGAWLSLHPEPPSTPVAVAAGPRSLHLQWTPPSSPDITGYLVQHGLTPDAVDKAIVLGTDAYLGTLVDDIVPFKPCYLKVAALEGNRPSRFSTTVVVTPGAPPVTDLTAVRRGKNEVDLSWSSSSDPSKVLGYWVYRRGDDATPTPADRITGDLVTGTTFADTSAPAFVRNRYWISEVSTEIFESDLCAPVSVYTRPDSVGKGTLLVNDYDWETTSDWWWPNVPADPFEMYEAFALTGDLSFTFWDTRDWFRYPAGYNPVGSGPLDPQVLFDHGLVVIAGSGLDHPKDTRFEEREEMLLEFFAAGGALFISGWNMGEYLPRGLQELFRVSDWDAPQAVTPSNLLVATSGQAPPVGPDPVLLSAPFCDVPELIPGFDLRVHFRLNTPQMEPLLWSVVGPTGQSQAFLLSASPSHLEHTGLATSIAPLIEQLGQAYNQTGLETPPPPLQVSRAFPNPGRSTMSISFSLAEAGPLSALVVDLQGRLVRSLYAGPHPAGPGRLAWDGRDDQGREAPAGVYFVRLSTHQFHASRRLVRLP